jgi:hypothetical protein
MIYVQLVHAIADVKNKNGKKLEIQQNEEIILKFPFETKKTSINQC